MLYEIGVRSSWRERGIGRSLLNHMEAWMKVNGMNEVWVLADNQIAVGRRARELAETKYSYNAYLERTRLACSVLASPAAPVTAVKDVA